MCQGTRAARSAQELLDPITFMPGKTVSSMKEHHQPRRYRLSLIDKVSYALRPGAARSSSLQDYPSVPGADPTGRAGRIGGLISSDHRLGAGTAQQPARGGRPS